eukprot:symbB.v1.2.034616.t1/scaffold4500.1/size38868/3
MAFSPNPAVKQTENGGDIPAPVEVEKKGGATPKDGTVVASERAKAQLDLAMAMEDHDLYRIKRFLPVAQNLGEIAAAQKLLEYDTIVVAVEDVKRLYSSIAKLRQRVEELQDKAARSTSPVLMEELEKRLWSRLEAQMTKMVAGAMAKFPAKLGAQASNSDPPGVPAPAPEAVVAAPEAVAPAPEASLKQIVRGTLHGVFSGAGRKLLSEKRFEEVDKDGDGQISQEELAATLTEMKIDGKEAEEAQKQVMQLADKDGDGVLSREELDQAKAQIASESPETSPAAPAVETESAKGGEKPAEAEGRWPVFSLVLQSVLLKPRALRRLTKTEME